MTKAGDARRAAIAEQAVALASVDGFDGLTFGSVAASTGVGKPALQTLFGSKETLQLAVLDAATTVWTTTVLRPASAEPDGLPQLRTLLARWIDYLPTFRGGCPFIAGASELDGRHGPVREALAAAIRGGEDLVRRQAALAIRLGELAADTDPDQVAYELHAVLLKANHDLQLFGDPSALDRARAAAEAVIARHTRSCRDRKPLEATAAG
ncbi:TetR/AcrR family transcriptional regulator [Desertimonas flava]|jgi:AcrR family transcriptional regulator|uniref:TetR/AcrR family transcriptional regulator n=1 Tax=Desertimonas flava TaxID=2064846 RepID=UPI000E34D76F|nr:TetR/AcrR family transcriptional regulator [Desertimonas flava]